MKKIKGLYFWPESLRCPNKLLDTPELREKYAREYDSDANAKLAILATHYGIKSGPDMYRQIAIALGRDMYPMPKKRGRKKKWNKYQKAVLVAEIERLRRPGDTAHGVEWACKTLAKREPWASFVDAQEAETTSANAAEALRKIYFEFRGDEWARAFRGFYKECEATGDIARWETVVSAWVTKSNRK